MLLPSRSTSAGSFPIFLSTQVTFLLVLLLTACGGGGGAGTAPGAQGTIAFLSDRALDGSDSSNGIQGLTNVWVIKSDGSGATPLSHYTNAVQIDFGSTGPVWSPDATKLTYTSGYALDGSNGYNPPFGVQNVWVMNADGSGATPLTRLTQTNCFLPVWSPDGSKIAYFSRRAVDGSDNDTATYNIWVINADGSNDHPVTQSTAQYVISENPQWSPNGTQIAFDSQRALDGSDSGNGTLPYYTPNIWVVNPDGSGALSLTSQTSGAGNLAPVWARQGGTLAFMGYDGNIWTVNSDGSGLKNLTNLTKSSSRPFTWSPDGAKLLFTSTRALDGSDNYLADSNLWLMNSDGTNPQPLTKLTKVDVDEVGWSTDFTQILYSSIRALDGSDAPDPNGTSNIWVMNADGSMDDPVTKLTAWRAASYAPAWKP